jgi:hypothetical protein
MLPKDLVKGILIKRGCFVLISNIFFAAKKDVTLQIT